MEITESKISTIIEEILQNLDQGSRLDQDIKTTFARSMAHQLSIKQGQKLKSAEMEQLMDALFSCQLPYVSIDGEPTLKTLSLEEVERLFKV